jgi:hypothetical protein
VRAEVVGDDDVAWVQRRDKNLFDVGEETGAVDRAIEDAWCRQPGDPERGEKRTGLPPRARRVVMDALAAQGTTVPAEQIVGDAGFVEKDEVGRIPARRRGTPRDARGRDVRPIVFGRPYGFF